MELIVKINLDNDSFIAEEGEDMDFNTEEISNCFRKVMYGLNNELSQGAIMDRNGNKIGTWIIEI